jgi:hypothetical protein
MLLKLKQFNTVGNITKITVLSCNGSTFNLSYPNNILLDIDILKLINSKNIIILHNNINKIINNYKLNNKDMFLVKEFIKWVIFTLNFNLNYKI